LRGQRSDIVTNEVIYQQRVSFGYNFKVKDLVKIVLKYEYMKIKKVFKVHKERKISLHLKGVRDKRRITEGNKDKYKF
jgi:hypothetical protein